MKNVNTKWNKENIIEKIQNISKKYNTVNFTPTFYGKIATKENCPCKEIVTKYFGSVTNAFNIAGIKFNSHYWSNKRIINTLINLYNTNGPFRKVDINVKFLKNKQCCTMGLIRRRFGSLDKAALYSNIKFVNGFEGKRPPSIGKNETILLDVIEKENNIILDRQYKIGSFYIDGFDKINNTAYEVDEENHKFNKQYDTYRQNKIEQIMGCKFVRIKDGW